MQMPSREARDSRAHQLRERAEGLRVIADLMADKNSKEALTKIATNYESLASRVETMGDASVFPFVPRFNL